MTTQPKLTLQMIKKRSSTQSFSRGQSYYNSQRVYDMVRRADEIQGYCAGSLPFPYFMRVQLTDGEIRQTTCTCEYDWGGDCKHIVALLLTYFHEPEKFIAQASIDDTLEKWEKVELISLIKQMVEQYPDLYRLLQMPMPSQMKASQQPIDMSSIQDYISNAFENYEGDYYDYGYRYDEHDPSYTAPHKAITDTQKNAQRFIDAGDWANAARMYTIILEEAIADGEKLSWDEDGSLIHLVNNVIDDLAKCLANSDVIGNAELRPRALQSILDIKICDILLLGGVNLGHDSVNYIVRYAQTADLPELYKLLDLAEKKASTRTSYGSNNWALEYLEQIRTQIETLDTTSIDVQLERLREKGMYRILAERLFDLKRGEEAIEVIHAHIDTEYERYQLLPILKENNYADVALNIALETLANPQPEQQPYLGNNRMRDWVIEEYHTRQDWDNVFQWMWTKFKAIPYHESYKEFKRFALEAKRWDTIFAEIIAYLEQNEQFALLTSIYLDEDEATKAWESLDKLKANPPSRYHWHFFDIRALELEVAYATQEAYPHRASEILLNQAEALIEARGRDNYKDAAGHLSAVRGIYQKLGKETEWTTLIGRIRTENKRLPALQDELKKAKL